MISRGNNSLSDFSLIAIIVVGTTGANIFYLPRIAAEQAGRDAWISIALAVLPACFIAGLIYLLCRRFPNRILPGFSVLILGKPLGVLVSLVYIVYTLSLCAITLRLFIELAKTWTMFWTPQWFFIVFLLIPVAYTTLQGVAPLGRLMEITLLILLLTVPLVILPAFHQFEPVQIRPVGQEGLLVIGRAIGAIAFPYLGFEVLLVFFPMFAGGKNILRLYLIGLIAVAVLFTGSALLTYTVMGIEYVRVQIWPLMEFLSLGRLPVLERIDNLFLFLWAFKIIGLITVQYYAATATAAGLTGQKYYSLWALLLLPVLYTITTFIGSQVTVFDLAFQFGLWGAVFITVLVLLLLLVAVIRGLDERKGMRKP
ncbi:MAG: GerAB/ArcD/ProY family transporter [Bacillota bacterium]